MGKRIEERIYKIENTEYLASKEVDDAIRYIRKAYGFKYLSQAREIYKNWRKEYIKDNRRW